MTREYCFGLPQGDVIVEVNEDRCRVRTLRGQWCAAVDLDDAKRIAGVAVQAKPRTSALTVPSGSSEFVVLRWCHAKGSNVEGYDAADPSEPPELGPDAVQQWIMRLPVSRAGRAAAIAFARCAA